MFMNVQIILLVFFIRYGNTHVLQFTMFNSMIVTFFRECNFETEIWDTDLYSYKIGRNEQMHKCTAI